MVSSPILPLIAWAVLVCATLSLLVYKGAISKGMAWRVGLILVSGGVLAPFLWRGTGTRRTPSGSSDDTTDIRPSDDTPTTYITDDDIDEILNETKPDESTGAADVSSDDPADWTF